MSSNTSSRLPGTLCILGVVMLSSFVMIHVHSRAFVYESVQTVRPVPLVLGLFGVCFIAYLFAIFCGVRSESKYVGLVVASFAIAFRLALLFSVPIQEIDIYRYVWDGHVSIVGVSPFKYSPLEVLESNPFAPDDERNDELAKLRNIPNTSAAKKEILERIHYGQVPTVYPPVSQFVFRLAAATTPVDANFETHIVIMKSWMVAFDIATIFAVWATLRIAKLPVGWLIAYAWCPLVLKEFANSGHLDSIAVCMSSIAIALVADSLFAESRSQKRQVIQLLTASVFLALGVGAKLYPVALAPLIAVTLWRRKKALAILTGTLFVFMTTICLFPLLTLEKPADANAQEAAHDPRQGLKVFFSHWMMNDLIFLNLIENSTPNTLRNPDEPTPWFVVLPDHVRESVTGAVSRVFKIEKSAAPFFIARTITAIVFVLLACLFAWQASKTTTASDWLHYVFLTMAWFWLLLPTLNPWYWIWSLPWIAFTRNRVWLALSGLLFIYYLRFHLGAHFETTRVIGTLPYHGEAFFDYVLVWLEYVPWFVCLFAAFMFRKSRKDAVSVLGAKT